MNKKVRIIISIVLAGVLVFSGIQLYIQQRDYKVADEVQAEVDHWIVDFNFPSYNPDNEDIADPGPFVTNSGGAADTPSPTEGDDGTEPTQSASSESVYQPFDPGSIDFELLRSVNPDIIGWIYIPNTIICYPLLKGTDNQIYVKTAYNGSYSVAGSIFMDFRNKSDLGSKNTIIYGHNMNNGSMFGTLKRYADATYLSNHRYIYIYLDGYSYVYDIFSTYKTTSTSEAYSYAFSSDEFVEYVAGLSALSDTVTPATADGTLPIITLSTCTVGNGSTERRVIHAVRLDYSASSEETDEGNSGEAEDPVLDVGDPAGTDNAPADVISTVGDGANDGGAASDLPSGGDPPV